MELGKMKIVDLRSADVKKLKQIQDSIRRELVGFRMDIYGTKKIGAGQKRKLKTLLAQALTVESEKLKSPTL